MVEIRPSRPEEAGAQKRLWKLAFGDGEQEIDWFYRCCWEPEHMLVLLEDGRLASMLALLEHTLTLPGGGRANARYIYALATDPALRGKGYGRQLLFYVDDYLKDRGADCVTVVPAEPSLHKFFATVGFQPGFSNRRLELLRRMHRPAQAGDYAQTVEPEQYNAIRERLLAELPSVCYPDRLIRYQQGMCDGTGGGLFRVVADGTEGCAAAEYVDEESVLFKELLLPPDRLERGLAALEERLPGCRCYVRTPAAWDGLPGSYIQAFGMIKWYNAGLAARWGAGTHGYMGLGFD